MKSTIAETTVSTLSTDVGDRFGISIRAADADTAKNESMDCSWATRWSPRRRHRQWSREEVQRLRLMADAGVPVVEIARALRRSDYSIRNKALDHGISLAASGISSAVRRDQGVA